MRFNDCLYQTLMQYLNSSQQTINLLKQGVDTYTNPGYTYNTVTKITNTWRLLNLSYQNIVQSLPFPIQSNDVNLQLQNPTLYQTNLNFLMQQQYRYPVQMVVWKMKLEDSDNSTVCYHPLIPAGLTATEADAFLGNDLPTTATAINAAVISTRPYAYQVFYTEYTWLGGLRRAFIMTYLPNPNAPYDWDTNPIYAVASGLLV